MKILIALLALISATAVSAQNVSTMKQSYLFCTPEDATSVYNLILENAAVGEAKAVKLLKFENLDWQTVAVRKIKKTIALFAPTGYISMQYSGSGFTAVHTEGYSSGITEEYKNNVQLNISVRGQALKMNFMCSTVE
jgi:hypothetical protein